MFGLSARRIQHQMHLSEFVNFVAVSWSSQFISPSHDHIASLDGLRVLYARRDVGSGGGEHLPELFCVVCIDDCEGLCHYLIFSVEHFA